MTPFGKTTVFQYVIGPGWGKPLVHMRQPGFKPVAENCLWTDGLRHTQCGTFIYTMVNLVYYLMTGVKPIHITTMLLPV